MFDIIYQSKLKVFRIFHVVINPVQICIISNRKYSCHHFRRCFSSYIRFKFLKFSWNFFNFVQYLFNARIAIAVSFIALAKTLGLHSLVCVGWNIMSILFLIIQRFSCLHNLLCLNSGSFFLFYFKNCQWTIPSSKNVICLYIVKKEFLTNVNFVTRVNLKAWIGFSNKLNKPQKRK